MVYFLGLRLDLRRRVSLSSGVDALSPGDVSGLCRKTGRLQRRVSPWRPDTLRYESGVLSRKGKRIAGRSAKTPRNKRRWRLAKGIQWGDGWLRLAAACLGIHHASTDQISFYNHQRFECVHSRAQDARPCPRNSGCTARRTETRQFCFN